MPRVNAERCAALLRQQGRVFLDGAPGLSVAVVDDMDEARRNYGGTHGVLSIRPRDMNDYSHPVIQPMLWPQCPVTIHAVLRGKWAAWAPSTQAWFADPAPP